MSETEEKQFKIAKDFTFNCIKALKEIRENRDIDLDDIENTILNQFIRFLEEKGQ